MCRRNHPRRELGNGKQPVAQPYEVCWDCVCFTVEQARDHASAITCTRVRTRRVNKSSWCYSQPPVFIHTKRWQRDGCLCTNTVRSSYSEAPRFTNVSSIHHLPSYSGSQACVRTSCLVGVRQRSIQGKTRSISPSLCLARLPRANCSNASHNLGEAENKLFKNIVSDSQHLLRHLLPPRRDDHYNLRQRASHNLQLPARTTALSDRNFFTRLMYRDLNYSQLSTTSISS